MSDAPEAVVKVGGSLFDLPDLRLRLTSFLEASGWKRVLLIPGGGPTAEAVRDFDRVHGLGEEASHWLALEALALNARFLCALLPGAVEVAAWADCPAVWQAGGWPILDAWRFARSDEGQPGTLPHIWDVTADAVAARVAEVGGARRLILLKSIALPADVPWSEVARAGWVDAYLPQILARTGSLQVQAVNLRTWTP